jgi:hypothetical protein
MLLPLTEAMMNFILQHAKLQVEVFSHRAPSRPFLVTDLVAEAERDLGRPAAAFNLQVGILPVEDLWGQPSPRRPCPSEPRAS